MVFLFEHDINELIKKNVIFYDGVLSETRGLSINKDFWFVNLSANQWKGINEDILIQELTKTITHELLHCIIASKLSGEEYVCQFMSDQIPEISFLE